MYKWSTVLFSFFLNLYCSHLYGDNLSLSGLGISKVGNYESQKESGFKPRNDTPPHKLSYPLDWNVDPFDDTNWTYQLHAWRMLDPIMRQYMSSRDELLLKEIYRPIEDWYNYHYLDKKQSDKQWYDMAAGIRAMKLSWLWQVLELCGWCYGDKALLARLAEVHVEKLLEPAFLSSNNHAYFQLVGLRLICNAIPSVGKCSAEAAYSSEKMTELLNRQFTTQFVHKEHSPSYHFFTINTLNKLKVEELFGGDVAMIIAGAKAVGTALVHPDGQLARLGDTSGKTTVRDTSSVRQSIPRHELQIADLSESGYISVRAVAENGDVSQLFAMGMSNVHEGHKHADELSFEFYHNEKLIFLDSGKYSYNRDEYRQYVLSARAHNGLSIKGVEIGPKAVEGDGSKLSKISITDNGLLFSGSVYRPGLFTHSRQFKWQPSSKLYIDDSFSGDFSFKDLIRGWWSDYSVVSSLHINPELDVVRISENEISIPSYARVNLKSDDCSLMVIKGQRDPLLGWVSFKYNQIEETNVIQAVCDSLISGSLQWDITLE